MFIDISNRFPSIHLAIPAMNEADYLPNTLRCIANQNGLDTNVAVHTWVCVNQPDHYWQDEEKVQICENNKKTLEYLHTHPTNNLHILDYSSHGKGWKGKYHGVGAARKTLMDSINQWAAPDDIIISMDADTLYETNYLASVVQIFSIYPDAVALSNPYYHKLSGEHTLDRAMLRYEIYMRHFAINMWRIGSPYNFTALGSAIALPVWAYRKIGGMTAKKSGEDFYLLQKLRKAGPIIMYNEEKVYPGTRYSDRVFFGTGPALIKGSKGLWDSYPIYDHKLFDMVGQTYAMFPALFDYKIETPMDGFLTTQFKETDIFEALRKNTSSKVQFIKACHHKIDGLRVLQFLKTSQSIKPWCDEDNLLNFLQLHHPKSLLSFSSRHGDDLKILDFSKSGIDFLDKLRNFLMEIEINYQKNQ
jgi:glycosyltransferase involved in cell wall biosynthesis